jgi:hypothetical protein
MKSFLNCRIWMMLGLLTTVSMSVMAKDASVEKKPSLWVLLQMADGSRLVGTPTEKTLRINTEYMKVEIPLAKIRQCEVRHQEERVILSLQNGDKLTGTLGTHEFRLEITTGKLAPEFAQIDRMTFTTSPPEGSSLRQADGIHGSTEGIDGSKMPYGWGVPRWTSREAAAPGSVEGQLRSRGKHWVLATGEITVGAYVQDILEDRLEQPKGRGAIGKVVSVSTGDNGKPVATVDFGRDYSVGIFFSELSPVGFVSVTPD